MSMLDSMDDALLGVDDDELDYDLEKEEEDALLADDPDNYDDENYEEIPDDTYANQTIHEEESEVLEIDVNVALDETEEDLGDQNRSKDRNIDSKLENDDPSDQEEEQQKERGRFTNERNNVMHRTLSNEIPDSLDKINVQQFNNNLRNGNKFQRNNNNKNRPKNRPNNNRGSVFGRMGILPVPGPPAQEDKNLAKTVLINPHFRGNVKVTENARLVWDAAQGGYPPAHQQRYPNPQMAQVAPFQSQFPQQPPSPWINPPYHHEHANNYQAPPPENAYNSNNNNNNHQNHHHQSHFNQSQGNFNNRDGRFNNTNMPPPLMSHPPPHFNQHTQPPPPLFPNRPFYHESLPRRQFSPQNNSPNNNFDSSYSQTANHAHHQLNNQNFNQQPPPYVQQQQLPPQHQQQQTYESGNDQHFTNQNYSNQYGGAIPFQNPQPQQNFQSPTNLSQNQSNFDGYNCRPNQNQFQPQLQVQFNNNRAFNNNPPNNHRIKNHQKQQQSINRAPPNFNQRTPPKRRPFENKNQIELRELPKKKKRSLELSNLHEVPTVDMPDTTTVEDKPESDDEETKAYRLKIEEQKILREKILREKEERRKLAAAQKETEEKLAPSDSLITTLKTKPAAIQQQFKIQPTNAPGLPITTQINRQTKQLYIHNQNRNVQNKTYRGKVQNQVRSVQQVKNEPRFNQNLAGTIMNQGQQNQIRNQSQIQSNQARINENLPQPIRLVQNQQNLQVQQPRMLQGQGNATRIFQKQQANIIITQKVTPEPQPQRIVMFNQAPAQQQQLQSAQQNNRRVVLKSNGATVDGAMLPETPVVVVSNLAAATTEPKIRKLCQGLGLVQNKLRGKKKKRRKVIQNLEN